ncbi:MAG: hypothetical protein IJM91_06750, partial [Lachnospiraceae bacterium]|nr:hypothetical protein [Lachnospiraceae bacterium]
MKKRLLAIVLTMAMVLSGMMMPAKAEAKEVHGFGLYLPEEIQGMSVEERAAAFGGTVYKADPQNFPTTFDLRDYGLVTPVKNQGEFGTCWAHAACGAMESNALIMGYGEYDLSEYQLAYFGKNMPDSQDAMIDGDGTEGTDKGKWYEHAGGNAYITTSMIMKGYAPASEEKYPYKNMKKKLDASAIDDCILRGNSALYVDVHDVNSIKAAITKFGAMTISVAGEGGLYDKKYYNEKTFASYLPEEAYGKEYSIDHEVCVIGWDDNFSKENFATQPEGDGAWLVRNSWGTDWGMEGYYWLSYYDAAIEQAGSWSSFTVSPVDVFDHLYQYDGGLGLFGMADALDVAMAFEVKADQTMTGVRINPEPSYETGEWTPVNATVKVYKGVVNPDALAAAKPIFTYTALIESPYYQTIEFNKGLNINAGDKLFVVVSFDHAVYYACDGPFEWQWLRNNAVANEGETFMRVERDGKWYDHGIEGGDADEDTANSVCLKVMVRDGHDQKVVHRDPNAIVLDQPTFYLLNNEEAKVTVTWKEVENAEGYNIYRKVKGVENEFTLLAKVEAGTTKYADKNLTIG